MVDILTQQFLRKIMNTQPDGQMRQKEKSETILPERILEN